MTPFYHAFLRGYLFLNLKDAMHFLGMVLAPPPAFFFFLLFRDDAMKIQVFLDAFKAFNRLADAYLFKGLKKIQCWEYMKCGKDLTSACEVITQNAGRHCWLVVGSASTSKVAEKCNDSFRKKSCKNCDFYLKVKKGEI
ncbi:two component signal transduction response regulator [Candidatus Magnetobacterium bavaricum]|uniref:Two component signal transduction response regulator n=1 Tax=Candidatus Magnetobacterium bavaricum TaxID=29290 RepID=A0A0F3GPL1_9BACT|nr:two component signal transduction response regulator [Candidatus Magnetobacterium bavaricum]